MRLSRTSTDEKDTESLEPLNHGIGEPEDSEITAPSSLISATDSAPSKASIDSTTKLWAAIFYAVSSLGTVFVMKIVLTSYKFPSSMFLALSQFILTTIVFGFLGVMGQLTLAAPSFELLWRVAPLTLIFLLNVVGTTMCMYFIVTSMALVLARNILQTNIFGQVTGLGGTKEISLPMFTVLRRFSILFTMLLEASVFGKSPPYAVKASVGMMLGGAVVAALGDISFHPVGYAFVLANGTRMNHGKWHH